MVLRKYHKQQKAEQLWKVTHTPWSNKATCSLPALLVLDSTLAYLPTSPLPTSSSSKLFYYLNFISSHFNFLNHTGYLKPQAWFNSWKLVGFKKRGQGDNRKKKNIQFCSKQKLFQKQMREKKPAQHWSQTNTLLECAQEHLITFSSSGNQFLKMLGFNI